ncbi:MAG TPA: sodium/proline symporter PutP, partial [Methanocorpusculum sp.]|nr:sodium/proline symporter PutP [Methanocorpusculum sp.]
GVYFVVDWNLIGILAAFIIYFGVMIYIGFYFMKKNKTASDYILGGRKLPALVSAMSAEASDMSGWLLLGLPGMAYAFGLSSAGWTAIGLAIGTYLNWRFVAKRLRVYTHRADNSLTLPEFITNRFKEKRGLISAIGSIFILVFFIIYTSAQFVAGGKLFSSLVTIYNLDLSFLGNPDLGMIYIIGILVCALIVVSYTFTGGFKAVCLTDTIMGFLMLAALILVPVIALVLLFSDGGAGLSSLDPRTFSLFWEYDPSNGVFEFVSVFTIISGLAWAYGYFGQPHILPRFMAIAKPEDIPKARRIAMVWVIITLTGAIFVGLVGQVLFPDPAALVGFDPEKVFIFMAGDVFGSLPFIAGLIYCGVLGAIMSTASSQLLVAASAISQDIYKNIINKKASDKSLLMVSKGTVLVVAIFALFIAFLGNATVFNIVSNAWAGFGCTFGSVILVGLFWRRMNWQGALSGIIVGGVVSFTWGTFLTSVTGLYEMVPGVIASLLTIVIVTMLTKEPEKEVLDTFDAYVKEIGNERT